jgi:hypothetical protein
MKKTLSLLVTGILIILACSCHASFQTTDNTEESLTKPIQTTKIIKEAQISWYHFMSLQDLLDDSQFILVGDVIEEGPIYLISDFERGGLERDIYYVARNITINVIDSIRGTLKPEDHFVVNQYLAYYTEEYILHKGERHLFFLATSGGKEVDGLPYCYLLTPFVSYPKIINGFLVTGKSDIMSDQPLDQAKKMIMDIIVNGH